MKDLSKEQKQMAVLAVILAGGLVYAALRFGLAPVQEKGAERKKQLDDIEHRLEQAKRVISQEERQRDEINRIDGEIRKVAALHIPPVENTLSWVTGSLYDIARNVGVEIEWVEKVDKVFPLPVKMQTEPQSYAPPIFKPYVVRVLTVCSYERCMKLIDELEKSNPYMCISEVQLVGQKSDVHNHRFTFVAEWPIWADYEQAMQALNQESNG